MASIAESAIISNPNLKISTNGDMTAVDEQLSAFLTSVRRHLHMNPELGLREFQTSRFIRETLEAQGLEVHGPLATTGLYVDIVGDHPGPLVGYRSDIDALPIADAKDASYKSQNDGVAHLCGHDAHTAMAVGVAVILNAHRGKMHGTARIFFQPNEEGIPSGAPLMIEDGVLDGMSAVYASHVDPTLIAGKFGLVVGAVTASADRFRVLVKSDSTGHSARPHQSIDTIWIATQIMSAMYQLVGRVTDARKAAVISICRLVGGEAYNVIPAVAEFGGTFRCIDGDDRELFKTKIEQTAKHIGEGYGAEVQVDFDFGAPAVINNRELIGHVRETIVSSLGDEAVYNIPIPSMGAEDFAHYLDHIPGALIRVGTAVSPETSYGLHDSQFDIDESILRPASQIMAGALLRYLSRHAQN